MGCWGVVSVIASDVAGVVVVVVVGSDVVMGSGVGSCGGKSGAR